MNNPQSGERLQTPHLHPKQEITINPEDGSVVSFPLSFLVNGNNNFHGVNFHTDAGKTFTVVNRGRHTGNPDDDGKVYILEINNDEVQYIAHRLDDKTVASGLINVGEAVGFGDEDETVTRITPVFVGGEKREAKEPEPEIEYQVSNDDEKLVKMMLYPDRGPIRMYDTLIESTSDREGWTSPEMQAKAQRGMRRLFEVALYPHELPDGGIREVRQDMQALMNDEDKKEEREYLYKAGIKMRYQSDYEEMVDWQGDFLHFGVNYTYKNEPDVLEHGVRVYVTPKKDSIGYVAASVIARARNQGYMANGKVWDDTTTDDDIDNRTDRVLFYVKTQSQLDIIMDALKETQLAHPDAFEENPPLLTEKTGIPGVGLAEDLPGGKSYNMARVDLIEEAWKQTRDEFSDPKPVKPTNDDYHIGENGMVMDMRHHKLRVKVENDPELMQEIIDSFRDNVRKLSAKHGVSPDNFTHNLVV